MPPLTWLIIIGLLIILTVTIWLFRSKIQERDSLSEEEKLTRILLEDKGKITPQNLLAQIQKTDNKTLCKVLAETKEQIPAEKWEEIARLLEENDFESNVIDLLESREKDVRTAAVEVLGCLEFPEARKPLLEALADKSDAVQFAAADALAKSKDPGLVEDLVDALFARERWLPARVAAVLLAVGEQSVDPLLRALSKAGEEEAGSIAEILGQLRDSRAVPALSRLLSESASVQTRAAAAEALGEINSIEALPALKEALKDEAREVRVRAVNSLGRFNDPSVMKFLEEAVEDKEYSVRSCAQKALANITSAPAKTQ